jgi:hypothetical protein
MSEGGSGRVLGPRTLAALVVLAALCGAGFGLVQSGVSDSTPNAASDVTETAIPSDASGDDASERATATPSADTNANANIPDNASTLSRGGGSDDADTAPSRDAPSTPASSESDGPESASVDLSVGRAAGESLRFDGAVPGATETVRLSVRNRGSEAGRLSLRVGSVVDEENGLLEPERDVGDDERAGELSAAVSVRVSAGDDYLVGGDDEWVSLSTLEAVDAGATTLLPGETRTLDVEWRVDPTAGNEIQTDTASVSVRLVLSQR